MTTELPVRLFAAAVGLAWAAALVADPAPEAGRLLFDDVAAVGGLGAALLVLAAPAPGRRYWLAAPVVAVAPALAAFGPDGWTVVAVLLVAAAWLRLWTGSDLLALVPAVSAAVYFLRTGPAGLEGPAPVVFAAAAVGVAVCDIGFGRRGPAGGVSTGLAVGLWAMAAAHLDRPFGPAAGALLLAAAVITLAVDRPAAALTALPGFVVTVAGLLAVLDRPAGVPDGAAWGALAMAVTFTAWTAARRASPLVWTVGRGLAVVAGAWLVMAPTTWGWVQPEGLDAYQDGVAVAAAGAGVVALGVAALRIRQTRW